MFCGVRVATGDAALGVPENAPYDRAIITIGSLDIPSAWFGQLKPGARLVVPLRWRGQTQSVALVPGEDGVFRSDSVFLCGFVPMIGQRWERSAALDAQELVRLYWDADTMDDPALPDLLRNPRDALVIEGADRAASAHPPAGGSPGLSGTAWNATSTRRPPTDDDTSSSP